MVVASIGTTEGRKKTARSIFLPMNLRFSSSATIRQNTITSTTLTNAYTRVTVIDFLNSELGLLKM
ncbi:hypothetical protein D3C80_2118370 [compost metagenome]